MFTANIVVVMIAIARSLKAAVIGFGARIMDDDRRTIVDKTDVMIIYKFWGWTKSINFKG